MPALVFLLFLVEINNNKKVISPNSSRQMLASQSCQVSACHPQQRLPKATKSKRSRAAPDTFLRPNSLVWPARLGSQGQRCSPWKMSSKALGIIYDVLVTSQAGKKPVQEEGLQ